MAKLTQSPPEVGLDVRKDFPLLGREVNGHPIVYLDSASSSQRPLFVLDAMRNYEETTHANVHRGVYAIAEEATRRFEAARVSVGRFIGAPDPAHEVVFAKNATEGINLVAHTWGRTFLHPGDAIVLTEMEHHANIVPWHILAAERDLEIRWIPIDDDGRLVLSDIDRLFHGAKLVGVTCMSNVLGTINPVAQITEAAHAAGAVVVADGAQSVPHLITDVAALGVDFLAFSAHKMLGPTGIGVLWGRREILESLPPFLGGGEMILDVRKDGFVPNEIPWRFEAGTPPIAEVIGLGAAVEYIEAVGRGTIRAHERALTQYLLETLDDRFGDRPAASSVPATSGDRGGVVSFAYRDIHAHDVSQVLDSYGVCVRAGHHCAKPLMRRLGVTPPLGPHSPSTTTAPTSTPWPTRWTRSGRSSDENRSLRWRRGKPAHPRWRLPPGTGGPSLMPGLEDLYREIILDHYRSPRNRGELASPPARRVEGFNPLCGDEVVVTVDVRRQRRGRHQDLRHRMLDQPVLGLAHVRRRQGEAGGRGARAHPHLQGDDVHPRGHSAGRRRGAPTRATTVTAT